MLINKLDIVQTSIKFKAFFLFSEVEKMESNSVYPSGICQRLINFVLRTMRRPSALPMSTQVPIEPGSSTISNGSVHSEIVVDFRHTERRVGDAILDPKKDGLVVISRDQTKLLNGSDRKGKKTVPITDSVKKADESDETKPRVHWPILSVESNINEKSDAYISSRKKAMGRNYTLDHEKHSQ